MRHFFLEPKTYSRPVYQRLADRRVVHSPGDVSFSGDALACPRAKLLEVASRNVAAESGSSFCSTPHVHACSHSFAFAGCGFVRITCKTYGFSRLRIE